MTPTRPGSNTRKAGNNSRAKHGHYRGESRVHHRKGPDEPAVADLGPNNADWTALVLNHGRQIGPAWKDIIARELLPNVSHHIVLIKGKRSTRGHGVS